ncbi:MAG: transposase, partial [Clostridiales bacterium]|nr:transposase [Clostridiales bacterium]
MDFIEGDSRNQITLLPDSIEDYVSKDNPVRVIDAYVNQLDFEALGFSKYQPNDTGRPMYDPKDLLKLYIYGYMNRIRSSRRLEQETKRNLEVIWLVRKISPDHKTIARFRHDNSRALKNVFRDFVKLCMKIELYGKELVAIDGSKFKAVNSKERNFNDRKLKDRIARIDIRIEEYMQELQIGDAAEDSVGNEISPEGIAQIIADLSVRKEQYQSYVEELARSGETQKSLTDPDSRLMKGNGKLDVCYNVQTAVDSKNKLIAEFEVTTNASDSNQMTPIAARAKEILEVDTLTTIAAAGYDSVQDSVDGLMQGIDNQVAGTDFDVCIPALNAQGPDIISHKEGRPVYFAERNIVLCPMGEVLYPK